ncbi:MAG TPA: glutathione peroxidase [Gammaproteobacteria bacterium]
MNVHDFTAENLAGQPVALADYAGKLLLIVNVASKCGFTPQYAGLEALYRKYHERGLEVLGFPCDQFAHQEPGDAETIRSFCTTEYGVTFPLFAKLEVNGDGAHPLYRHLRAAQPGELRADTPGGEQLHAILAKHFPELLDGDAVRWNFTKFLVGRDGNVLARFESSVTPEALDAEIAAAL